MPPSPSPPPDRTPLGRLSRNVGLACAFIVRGRAAANNWQVRVHLVIRILSIVLSSLGSAGVIVDKVSGTLPNETGWAFWGSVIVLLFGIGLQIANEFRIAQLAADSRLLAEQCALCETQLENSLIEEDPRARVKDLLKRLIQLSENARYNPVLPRMTPELDARAKEWAVALIDTHQPHWELPKRQQRRA
jgi:hypothetical protein